MAPEQLEGREIDPRTDLFALGTVLYEMLTARKAFDGASDASVMAAILTAEPRAMFSSPLAESVAPPTLDRVVRRALAKDPDERWQTARDLMNELQWILEDGSRGSAAAAPSIGLGRRLALLAIGAVAVVVVGFAARSDTLGDQTARRDAHSLVFFPASRNGADQYRTTSPGDLAGWHENRLQRQQPVVSSEAGRGGIRSDSWYSRHRRQNAVLLA